MEFGPIQNRELLADSSTSRGSALTVCVMLGSTPACSVLQLRCTLDGVRVRDLLLPCLLAVLGGCAAIWEDAPDVPEPGSPLHECTAESYAFAGRGTLAGLGLVGQSEAVLPDPDRPATIWVTRDPMTFEYAPEGSRMLCFEFDDGSGGSQWPVKAGWQPPAAAQARAPEAASPLLVLGVVAALAVGAGVLAFRRG